MSRKIVFLILSSFFLTGCLAESMTLVQSGVGASQGRVLQSTISPVLSLGIKQTTGKFPIEHMMTREKKRIAKKVSDFENRIIESTEKTIKFSKAKILTVKDNIGNQMTKPNDSLLKTKSFETKTFATENFKHKPRFSYKVR